MLSLPTLSSPYLTNQSYALLSALLRAPTLTLPAGPILTTLLTYSPSHHTLTPPWLDAIENTMVVLARTDTEACTAALPKIWSTAWVYLESSDVGCRRAAESALCAMVRYCITDAELVKTCELVQSASSQGDSTKKQGKKNKTEVDSTVVGSIILSLVTSLHAVSFAKATPSLLSILAALVSRLRLRVPHSTSSTTAAEVLLPELVVYVGGLRLAKGFEFREKADEVLGMAVRVLGPEVFLNLLPLNIIPSYVLFASPTLYLLQQTDTHYLYLVGSNRDRIQAAPSSFLFLPLISRIPGLDTSQPCLFPSPKSCSI